MGFLSGGDQPSAATSGTTIIAAGTSIDGTFELSCNLHVDGEVSGTIRCAAEVTIGKKGVVRGELEARKMTVSGLFDGQCSVASLEITKSGQVVGEMRAAELIVAKGGNFRGHCMEPTTQPKPELKPVSQPDQQAS